MKYIKLLIIFVLFLMSSKLYALTVKPGDTVYQLLSPYMNPQEILSVSKKIKKLGFELKIGQTYEFLKDELVVHDGITRDIVINLINKDVKEVKYPIHRLVTVVSGEIDDSLFYAVKKAGEDDILAVRLAEIFEWEIDFFKDIRKGDQFYVVVEKLFCRGKFIGYGKILGADFINQGRHIRALYYENKYTKGYFTPEGNSLKKGFLKAPLKFGRITSSFKYRRLHPVLHVYRPHYGVDYAAPIGTPIHATADGKVVKKGFTKANGYYIKLKHNNGYYTYYLHMSRFKKGIRVGSYVRQGDVIGYVGMTGYATGPHVDYRIMKNGSWINPLRFKSPTKRLSKKYLADFRDKTEYVVALLDSSYYKYAKLQFIQ
ncbi:peptidase, M23/M37 family [Deferribacter desulfuricans SSM1]|uniref:Peptidase, M23/M37 family n=1 Tax=Deferribacter desulfuricans (strain DSM 14783 / JCM 11476 / NBRC 101012 / SSM1) TaxID=639282 RepID=D3P8L5_DEFDS|nr:M23 family metallopeptidase [Deferribacter desulfuricans]BAI81055.1 peptidase, M23/M37 family [Deferribacter desulfuricans SSM1]